MPVLISNSLVASVSKLDAVDAKRVWGFLQKFLENPAQPGISLERIETSKSKDLWSGRITQDLRAILYQDSDTWMVLYAGHHDDAYDWASTKQIERHVKTGALQIVEAPVLAGESFTEKPLEGGLFDAHEDDYLISLGLPPTWLPTIRKVTSEDTLLDKVLPKLPEEVAERLLSLAMGEFVTPPVAIPENRPVMESLDTRRRFFVLENNDDLLKMLEAPLATWLVFLHPSQRKLAVGIFNGPVKITGSAGTGKTVVAIHRARHQANEGKRVLFTTYVTTLCRSIERNLRLLCSDEERSRITVSTVHSQARKILNAVGDKVRPVDEDRIGKLIEQASRYCNSPIDQNSLLVEWGSIIQAQNITSWEQYRVASRAGRGTPLSVKDRQQVWKVFERVYEELQARKEMSWSSVCRRAVEHLKARRYESPYDAVIVDEMQDLGPQELMLLVTLARDGQAPLMLAGDGGQRIYAGKFSLKALGIDVRGRSHVLRLNYRTTEQIRRFADTMIAESVDDLDGGHDRRRGTRSVLTGPEPTLRGFASKYEQSEYVANEIVQSVKSGLAPSDIAVFARTGDQLFAIEDRLHDLGVVCHRLSKDDEPDLPSINLGTMHRAKGLEFKVVFVIDASANVLPHKMALKGGDDPQVYEDALARERQLLYVSITRARDEVFISWVGEPTQFLESVLNTIKQER